MVISSWKIGEGKEQLGSNLTYALVFISHQKCICVHPSQRFDEINLVKSWAVFYFFKCRCMVNYCGLKNRWADLFFNPFHKPVDVGLKTFPCRRNIVTTEIMCRGRGTIIYLHRICKNQGNAVLRFWLEMISETINTTQNSFDVCSIFGA